MIELKNTHLNRFKPTSQIGGFLDFLNPFKPKKTKTSSEQTTDSTRTIEGEETEVSTGTAEQTTEGRTTSLDEGTRDALSGLIDQLAGEVAADEDEASQIRELGQILFDRAITAEQDINAQNAAIINAQKLEGEKQVARLNAELADAVGGSRFNSFVAGSTAEALTSLDVNLGALEAGLKNQSRDTMTRELLNVVETLKTGAATSAAGMEGIAALAGSLKGGEVVASETQAGTTTEAAASTKNITEIINEVVKGKGKETAPGKDLLDLIDIFVN